MSSTDEQDGFITVSENSTEGSVDEGSGMESTEIIVGNEVKEFDSTEKSVIQPTITANSDWILIAIVVGSVCCVAVVIIVAVIFIRRRRNSREETFGNSSRTNSIDYLNQVYQLNRNYKNPRNDNIGIVAEVVRVPSFKTRGVAAPLNLPEEIPLKETKLIIGNKRDASHLPNQSSANSLSRSNQVFPCEQGETMRVRSIKHRKYPEGSTPDHHYAKPDTRRALAARIY
jgi:hypothetical protein